MMYLILVFAFVLVPALSLSADAPVKPEKEPVLQETQAESDIVKLADCGVDHKKIEKEISVVEEIKEEEESEEISIDGEDEEVEIDEEDLKAFADFAKMFDLEEDDDDHKSA